jgi:hypothetical protein
MLNNKNKWLKYLGGEWILLMAAGSLIIGSISSSNGSCQFIIKFLIIGYAAFAIGILLYFILSKVL